MDIERALKSIPHHNNYWIERYLSFLDTADEPKRTFDQHHILPRAIFPEVASFKRHPWNCIQLRPADHLFAHYYLYRALPRDSNAIWAFKLMVGKHYADLIIQGEDEVLLLSIAKAYEQVRYGQENSPSITGWVRMYRGEEATVIAPEFLDEYTADGWVRTKPPYQWVTNETEDRRVKPKDVQAYLDRGYTLGRSPFHTEAGRASVSVHSIAHHAAERAKGADAYAYAIRGDQHPSRIYGISEETRTKIAAALTGRAQSPESVEKRRLKMLGQHWSWAECSATRQKKSEAMTGPKNRWHGTRGPMGGLHHTSTTRAKMSASHKVLYQNPEFVSRVNAIRPRGEGHWAYGKEVPAETRVKISATLTGKAQPDETIQKRVESRVLFELSQITPEEDQAFRAALLVKTEEEMLACRKAFKINSRPYNILTGLITIRLGKQEHVAPRYWQQAWNWLQAAKLIWCEVTPAAARLGTGHRLAPTQLSAHELRKTGLPKGIGAARKAFAEIPEAERTLLLNAWQQAWSAPGPYSPATLIATRKQTAVRTRPYNILYGLQWITEGKATPASFPRWRQAAIFLRLSGREVPVGPEALAALDQACPAEAIM